LGKCETQEGKTAGGKWETEEKGEIGKKKKN